MSVVTAVKDALQKLTDRLPATCILFESAPDLGDNTKPVFDEMLKRKLNQHYKLVWVCFDEGRNYPKYKNVRYVEHDTCRSSYYAHRAKCAVSCNHFVFAKHPEALNVYLTHGNPLKNTKGYYRIPAGMDYINSSSENMMKLRTSFYGLDPERFCALGHPRNDVFALPPLDLHPYFDVPYKKIIVWYPTFRQSKKGNSYGGDHALPVVWNEEKAQELNAYAKEKDVLIVLKPHFAQDVSKITQLSLSNIVFINDEFFKKHNLTSYRFVGSCDAMLTDYSSIYYDYTLCDKPIGLTWEDYEEYKENPGFAVDMDYMMKGGVKIYTLEDLKNFVRDVAEGVDRLREERREIRDFANYSTDGENAKRVTDFIVEKAKL